MRRDAKLRYATLNPESPVPAFDFIPDSGIGNQEIMHAFSSEYLSDDSDGSKFGGRRGGDLPVLGAPGDCRVSQRPLRWNVAHRPDRRPADGQRWQWILDGIRCRCEGQRPLSLLGGWHRLE